MTNQLQLNHSFKDLLVLTPPDEVVTGKRYRMVFSSLALLSNIVLQAACAPSFFAIDTTYKITHQTLNASIVITVDCQQRAHPIAFMLGNEETSDHYRYFLRAIKEACLKLLNRAWEPVFAISDNSAAIMGAIRQEFPAITGLNCYAHLVMNIKKKSYKSLLKVLLSNSPIFRTKKTLCD